MSDESVSQAPAVFSSKERAALVAKALSEAARRARFSTKRRRSVTSGGLRARRGARLFSLIRLVSFVAVVALPLTILGIYVFFLQSSQYSAESRFTVSGGIPLSADAVGMMTGLPSDMIMQDTQIIISYLESRAIIEDLEKSIHVKAFFERPSIDYFSRLKPNVSAEKLARYWEGHVAVKIEMPAGIVRFAVRAFSPEDSAVITSAALDASEQLVNRMNDQMRRDAVAVAEAQRKRAQAHLAEARATLEQARNEEGMLSAQATSESYDTLIDSVKTQMMTLQENYDSQRRFVTADAPQLREIQARIDAAKQQIAKLQAQITENSGSEEASGSSTDVATGSHVLSGSMSRLDYATLENQIAEKIYAASLAGVETAHVADESKLMYVNRFIEPVAPQKSNYPNRPVVFLGLTLIAFAVWGVILGATKFALNKLL